MANGAGEEDDELLLGGDLLGFLPELVCQPAAVARRTNGGQLRASGRG